jgi:hypothetical protein
LTLHPFPLIKAESEERCGRDAKRRQPKYWKRAGYQPVLGKQNELLIPA